jgi:hypothetical protein
MSPPVSGGASGSGLGRFGHPSSGVEQKSGVPDGESSRRASTIASLPMDAAGAADSSGLSRASSLGTTPAVTGSGSMLSLNGDPGAPGTSSAASASSLSSLSHPRSDSIDEGQGLMNHGDVKLEVRTISSAQSGAAGAGAAGAGAGAAAASDQPRTVQQQRAEGASSASVSFAQQPRSGSSGSVTRAAIAAASALTLPVQPPFHQSYFGGMCSGSACLCYFSLSCCVYG